LDLSFHSLLAILPLARSSQHLCNLRSFFLNAFHFPDNKSPQPLSKAKVPYPLGAPRPLARALLTVALPLANPTPLPFTPLLLNIGAFLKFRIMLVLASYTS
jgi:hypothetical protein